MKFQKIKIIASYLVIFSLLVPFTSVRGEAVSDPSSAISPLHPPGNGEFVHGQGYGKLLIRVLMMGAIPQQGVHYFPEGTDVLFGLMYCGGENELTKMNGIQIRRRGVKDIIDVNLADLIEDGKPLPRLYDGDLVHVPFNWKRDMSTILTITSFVTSLTGFALSLIALTRKN